jgi:N-acyl homoserine lactone hydrolase
MEETMTLVIHPMKLGEGQADTSFLCWGLTPGTTVWVPCTAYLILGGDTPIVVDAGIRDAAELEANTGMPFRLEAEHTLDSNLARHGLEPGDVGIVILTHLHLDHTGLLDKFPNARFLVQRSELEYADAPLFPAIFYETVDLDKLNGPLRGRVELLDGDTQIAPGVRTILTGGHSPGHQMVYVDVASGQAIICGDNAYLVDPGVTMGIPPGYIVSLPDTLAALAQVKRDGKHILPMHDETVYAAYPDGVS